MLNYRILESILIWAFLNFSYLLRPTLSEFYFKRGRCKIWLKHVSCTLFCPSFKPPIRFGSYSSKNLNLLIPWFALSGQWCNNMYLILQNEYPPSGQWCKKTYFMLQNEYPPSNQWCNKTFLMLQNEFPPSNQLCN